MKTFERFAKRVLSSNNDAIVMIADQLAIFLNKKICSKFEVEHGKVVAIENVSEYWGISFFEYKINGTVKFNAGMDVIHPENYRVSYSSKEVLNEILNELKAVGCQKIKVYDIINNTTFKLANINK